MDDAAQSAQHAYVAQSIKNIIDTDAAKEFTDYTDAAKKLASYHIFASIDGEAADMSETPDGSGKNLIMSRRHVWGDLVLRRAHRVVGDMAQLRSDLSEHVRGKTRKRKYEDVAIEHKMADARSEWEAAIRAESESLQSAMQSINEKKAALEREAAAIEAAKKAQQQQQVAAQAQAQAQAQLQAQIQAQAHTQKQAQQPQTHAQAQAQRAPAAQPLAQPRPQYPQHAPAQQPQQHQPSPQQQYRPQQPQPLQRLQQLQAHAPPAQQPRPAAHSQGHLTAVQPRPTAPGSAPLAHHAGSAHSLPQARPPTAVAPRPVASGHPGPSISSASNITTHSQARPAPGGAAAQPAPHLGAAGTAGASTGSHQAGQAHVASPATGHQPYQSAVSRHPATEAQALPSASRPPPASHAPAAHSRPGGHAPESRPRHHWGGADAANAPQPAVPPASSVPTHQSRPPGPAIPPTSGPSHAAMHGPASSQALDALRGPDGNFLDKRPSMSSDEAHRRALALMQQYSQQAQRGPRAATPPVRTAAQPVQDGATSGQAEPAAHDDAGGGHQGRGAPGGAPSGQEATPRGPAMPKRTVDI